MQEEGKLRRQACRFHPAGPSHPGRPKRHHIFSGELPPSTGQCACCAHAVPGGVAQRFLRAMSWGWQCCLHALARVFGPGLCKSAACSAPAPDLQRRHSVNVVFECEEDTGAVPATQLAAGQSAAVAPTPPPPSHGAHRPWVAIASALAGAAGAALDVACALLLCSRRRAVRQAAAAVAAKAAGSASACASTASSDDDIGKPSPELAPLTPRGARLDSMEAAVLPADEAHACEAALKAGPAATDISRLRSGLPEAGQPQQAGRPELEGWRPWRSWWACWHGALGPATLNWAARRVLQTCKRSCRAARLLPVCSRPETLANAHSASPHTASRFGVIDGLDVAELLGRGGEAPPWLCTAWRRTCTDPRDPPEAVLLKWNAARMRSRARKPFQPCSVRARVKGQVERRRCGR